MIIKRIYKESPVWLQNLIVSGKGAEFRVRRSNTKLLKAQFNRLLESEWWSKEEFQRFQQDSLRHLIETIRPHVPHYADLLPTDNITDLPFLEKETVRNSGDSLVNRSILRSKHILTNTSGTTGTPMVLRETKESFSQGWAFVARARQWAGVSPFFPRRAQFTGRPIVSSTDCRKDGIYWRHNMPGKALLLSTVHISPITIPGYAKALNRFKPELIDGYPSALVSIARVCMDQHISLTSPKAIMTSAETLLPEWRRDIESAFGCKVYDLYAASEPCCCWSECNEGRMHIHPEYGISEIICDDGRPAKPGESGEIVTTSFFNTVMPLVRYRIGDRAKLSTESNCPCGRNMTIVEAIEGRKDDILYFPERGFVGRLDPVFKGVKGILEAQIVQETLSRVVVLIVPSSHYSLDDQATLKNNFRQKIGHRVELTFERVERIPRGPNGKFRTVVSLVKNEYPYEV